MVNPRIQGKNYRPLRPYLVSREKVREFALAVQSSSAVNYDADEARALGFADVVAPPTFAAILQSMHWNFCWKTGNQNRLLAHRPW